MSLELGSEGKWPHWISWRELESEGAAEDLARFVREGGVVIFPTESSYALGADPASSEGVGRVFEIKRRHPDKPLPVVVPDLAALERLGVDATGAVESGLAGAWPGPLTVILPCRAKLPAACGRRELAVRVPGHARLLELLMRTGLALTATSANRSGADSVVDPEQLRQLTDRQRLVVIEEGRLAGGPPSTIVRVQSRSIEVLRQGAIDIDTLRSEFSSTSVEIPVEEGG